MGPLKPTEFYSIFVSPEKLELSILLSFCAIWHIFSLSQDFAAKRILSKLALALCTYPYNSVLHIVNTKDSQLEICKDFGYRRSYLHMRPRF